MRVVILATQLQSIKYKSESMVTGSLPAVYCCNTELPTDSVSADRPVIIVLTDDEPALGDYFLKGGFKEGRGWYIRPLNKDVYERIGHILEAAFERVPGTTDSRLVAGYKRPEVEALLAAEGDEVARRREALEALVGKSDLVQVSPPRPLPTASEVKASMAQALDLDDDVEFVVPAVARVSATGTDDVIELGDTQPDEETAAAAGRNVRRKVEEREEIDDDDLAREENDVDKRVEEKAAEEAAEQQEAEARGERYADEEEYEPPRQGTQDSRWMRSPSFRYSP